MLIATGVGGRRKPRPNPGATAAGAASETVNAWTAHSVTARALQERSIAPLRHVIPGVIPAGAALLVSRPKLGKSWLALDLAIAIASGRAALNAWQPQCGDVLYLALEDGELRLARRMATLLPADEAWPERLTVATQWRRAHDGGLADIADWCRSARDPAAVVIDTLDRFCTLNGRASAGPMRDALAELSRVAGEHGVAVIAVHHERRRGAGDPLDTVSGPAGLGGAADTILILKHRDGGAVLYARGRDIEEKETLLLFDRSSCRWRVGRRPGQSDARAAVIDVLARTARPQSVRDIVAATGKSRGAIDTLLYRMVADGLVERVREGYYRLVYDHPDCPLIEVAWPNGKVLWSSRPSEKTGESVRSEPQDVDPPCES